MYWPIGLHQPGERKIVRTQGEGPMAGSHGTTRLSPRGSWGPWGSVVGRERALGASHLDE